MPGYIFRHLQGRPEPGTGLSPGTMDLDVIAALPTLLPQAVAWAHGQEEKCRRLGRRLAFWQVAEARDVGVRSPERVRLCILDALPLPSNLVLRSLAMKAGLPGDETRGLSFGYAILLCRSHAGERRLLRHELRHVAQYEQAGSMMAFMGDYLRQMLRHGCQEAPFEVEARRFETSGPGQFDAEDTS